MQGERTRVGRAPGSRKSSTMMSPQVSPLHRIKAITFDVFGTLVDWYGSLVREGETLGHRTGLEVDWHRLALEWRAGYGPAMRRVNEGRVPWGSLDLLHSQILEDLLPRFGMAGLSPGDVQEFNLAWHRLDAWPDVQAGLPRLRTKYLLAPLSNGNIALLVDLARFNGWDWDCVLSSELAGRYKPDPAVYRTAARLLGLAPEEVLMVAAHADDLEGARGAGLRTGYLDRPKEFGPHEAAGQRPQADVRLRNFDLYVSDLDELAVQLKA